MPFLASPAAPIIFLPARQQFGALQHKTFPIYFVISISISTVLLALWTYSHPGVVSRLHEPKVGDVAQVYALGTVLLAQCFNYFLVGPLTSK